MPRTRFFFDTPLLSVENDNTGKARLTQFGLTWQLVLIGHLLSRLRTNQRTLFARSTAGTKLFTAFHQVFLDLSLGHTQTKYIEHEYPNVLYTCLQVSGQHVAVKKIGCSSILMGWGNTS